MPGERDLDLLLRSLRPILDPDEFVFATHHEAIGDPVAIVREREGVTLILRRAEAERLGIAHTFPCRRITLEVHSSLDAVGLMARISSALAAKGISINPVSGYYHDHLFVPVERADEAVAILQAISPG
jgi:uncharacterized protein